MDIFTLDLKGTLLAVVMALLMWYFGGPVYGLFFVITMVVFLVLSAIVTNFGKQNKQKNHLFEASRGVKNVFANGMGPLCFSFLVFVGSPSDLTIMTLGVVGFFASAAAVTADKFSSEIGVLNGDPTSIITFKKLKKGTSGGVSGLGLAAGLLGALLIGIVSAIELNTVGFFTVVPLAASVSFSPVFVWWALFAFLGMITLGGFIGTIVDSILGHWEEKDIGSKYTTNFICSIIGGLAAFGLYLIIFGSSL